MPTLLEVNQAYRQALAANEAQAVAQLTRAYKLAWGHLSAEVERLAQQAADEALSPYGVMQLARYRSVQAQLAELMQTLVPLSEGVILAQQGAALSLASQAALAQIEATLGEQARENVELARVPDAQLKELQGFLAPGSPLRDSLDHLGPLAAQQVTDGLVRGITLGLGPRQMVPLVRDAFGGNLTSALTYTRTATQYAARSAQLEHFKANEDVVEGVVWTSAADARCCAACFALQGKFFPLKDAPLKQHRNCRCSLSPKTRGSRVEFQQGEDIFATAGEATQRAVLGRGGYEAYKRGDLKLVQMIGESQDKALGTVYTRRSLRDALGAKEAEAVIAEAAKAPPANPFPKFTGRGDAEDWAAGHWSGFTRAITKEQRAALDNYTGFDHKTINGLLRGNLPIPKSEYDPAVLRQARKDTRILDGVMNKETVDRDVTVWRAATVPEWVQQGTALEGAVIRDPGYMSTSVLKSNVERFERWAGRNDQTPIVMEIQVPAGSRAAYLEGYQQEKFGTDYAELPEQLKEAELLLPRDSSFVVKSVSMEASGTMHMVMELLPDGG